MPFYDNGDVHIYYEETGSGFPLLLIPGGGLNSSIANWSEGDPLSSPFNAIEEFRNDFRCISMDLRHSDQGQSSGPLELEDPWGAYAQDHLGLMDHLGFDQFLVLGMCIGGPFILKLMEAAPERVVAGVVAQSSGYSGENPDLYWSYCVQFWGPDLCARQPEITMDMVEAHLHRLYRVHPDFVFSVDREFVQSCQTPMLVLPDNTPAHPFQVSMDIFKLAPNAEVSHFPWKEPESALAAVVDRVGAFLRAHVPAYALTELDPRNTEA